MLHNNEANFHQKLLMKEADQEIQAEFQQGKRKLLPADKFLFRSKEITLKKSLEDKQKWLGLVSAARAAFKAAQEEDNYNLERARMRAWLNAGIRSGIQRNCSS